MLTEVVSKKKMKNDVRRNKKALRTAFGIFFDIRFGTRTIIFDTLIFYGDNNNIITINITEHPIIRKALGVFPKNASKEMMDRLMNGVYISAICFNVLRTYQQKTSILVIVEDNQKKYGEGSVV
jgi:hypothetical protein